MEVRLNALEANLKKQIRWTIKSMLLQATFLIEKLSVAQLKFC